VQDAVSTTAPPIAGNVAGLALNEQALGALKTGGGGAATVTSTDALLDPAALLATTENVVVAATVPDTLFDAVFSPSANPPAQVKPVGLPPPAQFTLSVTVPPATGKVEGLAANEQEEGGAILGPGLPSTNTSMGAVRVVVVLSPRAPVSPQHLTPPAVVTAQV